MKPAIGIGAGEFDAYAYSRLCQHLGYSAVYRRDPDRLVTAELFDECAAFEHDFARARHENRSELCEQLAGHYSRLSELAPFADGPACAATRDAYITAALSAKGLSMDLSGLPGLPGEDLAAEMSARLEARDPEIASAWLVDFGDGIDRDGYGRKRDPSNGRPDINDYPSLWGAGPGGYVRRMREDGARIERKRENTWRDACRSMGQDVPDYVPAEEKAAAVSERQAPEPAKQGGFARLAALLRRGDGHAAAGRDGPEY